MSATLAPLFGRYHLSGRIIERAQLDTGHVIDGYE